MVASFALAGSLAVLASLSTVTAVPLESRAVKNTLPSYISTNLGPYSPYVAQADYPAVPVGCTINQVRCFSFFLVTSRRLPSLTRRFIKCEHT
jgi:hypothetical protein